VLSTTGFYGNQIVKFSYVYNIKFTPNPKEWPFTINEYYTRYTVGWYMWIRKALYCPA